MKEARKVIVIGDRPPADLIEWVAQQVVKRLAEETKNETLNRTEQDRLNE